MTYFVELSILSNCKSLIWPRNIRNLVSSKT